MTKIPVTYAYEIPVDYAHEEVWKVNESKEDKKMKRFNWTIDDTVCVLKTTGLALFWVAMFTALCSLFDYLDSRSSHSDDALANQAQCESIGGRYDGEACWYNGEKIDVNKYVEEWK